MRKSYQQDGAPQLYVGRKNPMNTIVIYNVVKTIIKHPGWYKPFPVMGGS
jgi:hypothetical protein